MEKVCNEEVIQDSIISRLKSGEIISHMMKECSIAELEYLSAEIRNRILNVVSGNGGHLSSTLGAVELIVGMHATFDCSKHPFIFDVSHQAYAHKILTGRYNEFHTLRQLNGISGFIAPYESPFDYFIAGHSSTSISLALGSAKAKKLLNDEHKPVVMVGDGALSAGMAYEAINELGDLKLPVVIILNDNEMSISKPIGAISRFLSSAMTAPLYQNLKQRLKRILSKMPDSASYMMKRFEESFKLITPGLLFEELGLNYIGPINGHNIELIISTINRAKTLDAPVIIHAQTTKGKGYKIAEGKYEKWHGVGPFDLKTGLSKKTNNKTASKSPTSVFSDKLLELAKHDEMIVGFTAAMPTGSGLDKLIDEFPDRFYDVGIAEQHALTSSASMAKEGFKPYIAIYSTFLQRAYDQIIHDVSIMNLPVKLCIDRAGIVGEDGETHQGLFDISYLKNIPNWTILAPRNNSTLEKILDFSVNFNSPLAFRYPRGKFSLEKNKNDDTYFKCLENFNSQMIEEEYKINETNILFIGYGNGVGKAFYTKKYIKDEMNINISILDLIYLKPLDENTLLSCFIKYEKIFVFSDSYKINGVGNSIIDCAMEFYSKNEFQNMPKIFSFEIQDKFIRHGNIDDIERLLNIDIDSLSIKILNILKNEKK